MNIQTDGQPTENVRWMEREVPVGTEISRIQLYEAFPSTGDNLFGASIDRDYLLINRNCALTRSSCSRELIALCILSASVIEQ